MTAALEAAEQRTRLNVTTFETNRPRLNATLRIANPKYDYISELGGQKVFVKGNLATLEDGTIAGSVAKMNEVLKNFCANTSTDIAAGVEMVTKNPAVELGIFDKTGSLEVGKSADIVIFDDDFNIKQTFINGQRNF